MDFSLIGQTNVRGYRCLARKQLIRLLESLGCSTISGNLCGWRGLLERKFAKTELDQLIAEAAQWMRQQREKHRPLGSQGQPAGVLRRGCA